MPVRQQLKTRTLFNVGPADQPGASPLALIGVYSPELVLPIAETPARAGLSACVAVVHGGGMDEVSDPRHDARSGIEQRRNQQLPAHAAVLRIGNPSAGSLAGRHAGRNRDILARLLQGKGELAHAAAVAANVALLLKLFGHEDLRQNARQALDMINSGQAYERVIVLAARG